MLEEAGCGGDSGRSFGPAGADYVRFSFASSTAILKEAVERILRVSSAWQGTPATTPRLDKPPRARGRITGFTTFQNFRIEIPKSFNS